MATTTEEKPLSRAQVISATTKHIKEQVRKAKDKHKEEEPFDKDKFTEEYLESLHDDLRDKFKLS
jgi:hypothetical protein